MEREQFLEPRRFVRPARVPAMYAMGMYDYDASIGVGVFGNYHGELAVFDACEGYTHQQIGYSDPIKLVYVGESTLLSKV